VRSRAPRLALVALAAAATGCSALDPMMEQQKVKPYGDSRFYADGRGMRDPPAGTVQSDAERDPAVAAGVGPDGAPLATAPVPVTRELLERGRREFDITCAACHGVLGDGDSPVARNMALHPPPSLHDRIFPEGYTFRVITEGYGLMPSYADHLSVRDRWAVVAYLRALRIARHAALAQAPADERARLEAAP
jgi:mono/diheme cytochrome c family protein